MYYVYIYMLHGIFDIYVYIYIKIYLCVVEVSWYESIIANSYLISASQHPWWNGMGTRDSKTERVQATLLAIGRSTILAHQAPLLRVGRWQILKQIFQNITFQWARIYHLSQSIHIIPYIVKCHRVTDLLARHFNLVRSELWHKLGILLHPLYRAGGKCFFVFSMV